MQSARILVPCLPLPPDRILPDKLGATACSASLASPAASRPPQRPNQAQHTAKQLKNTPRPLESRMQASAGPGTDTQFKRIARQGRNHLAGLLRFASPHRGHASNRPCRECNSIHTTHSTQFSPIMLGVGVDSLGAAASRGADRSLRRLLFGLAGNSRPDAAHCFSNMALDRLAASRTGLSADLLLYSKQLLHTRATSFAIAVVPW